MEAVAALSVYDGATVHVDGLPRDIRRIIGCKKYDGCGDLIWLTGPFHGRVLTKLSHFGGREGGGN